MRACVHVKCHDVLSGGMCHHRITVHRTAASLSTSLSTPGPTMTTTPLLQWQTVALMMALLVAVCVSQTMQAGRRPDLQQSSRMTIANMTCHFFEQPLNHFVPRGSSPTYKQRYCLYNGFMTMDAAKQQKNETYPIFLYTGNESPLEQYVNHTGLMWELAPRHQAQVVFMEHRYEGQSLPYNLSEKCMSYSSTVQALADFVTLLNHLNPDSRNPVIAFGGSYGGMLCSWLRMKYPNMVAGAIAASAPIWGLPKTARSPNAIDACSRVVARGVSLPYPPTNGQNKETNYCGSNMLSAWPLISFLGETVVGRDFLKRAFRLCHSLTSRDDMTQLLAWAQSPWFDMAEGSFPYPSNYIPFSLHNSANNLPAWPIQAACWRYSQLHRDWGITFDIHNKTDVKYGITYGDSGIVLDVDWYVISPSKQNVSLSSIESSTVKGLLTSLRDAVAVWFNITKDLQCFNVTPADNDAQIPVDSRLSTSIGRFSRRASSAMSELRGASPSPITNNDADTCLEKMKAEGSWSSLCCNEDVNMPITLARGMGRDFYWPPDFPRGTRSYADIVASQADAHDGCSDPDGLFGYPPKADPWGEWLDVYYGGLRIGSHSNIVFSNGLLDPWSAGGVYAQGFDPTAGNYKGPMVQNLTSDGSMIALIIKFGGHHTDLMYSDPRDPQCVTDARRIENDFITRWIREWKKGRQLASCISEG